MPKLNGTLVFDVEIEEQTSEETTNFMPETKTEIPTPRTDSQLKGCNWSGASWAIQFASQLERELIAAQEHRLKYMTQRDQARKDLISMTEVASLSNDLLLTITPESVQFEVASKLIDLFTTLKQQQEKKG